MKKYNYTYKLTLKSDPRYYYFGKHSTNLEPEQDPYLGSGRGLLKFKKQDKTAFIKEILGYWNSPEEALEEEAKLVTKETLKDPFCLNRRPGGNGPGREDTTGKTWIHFGNEMRLIPESEVPSYLKVGWKRGVSDEYRQTLTQRPKHHNKLSELHKQHLSEAKLGKPNLKARGLKRTEEQRAHMSKPRSLEGRKRMSEASLGKIWIHKEAETKRIRTLELEKYTNQGWKQGRKSR